MHKFLQGTTADVDTARRRSEPRPERHAAEEDAAVLDPTPYRDLGPCAKADCDGRIVVQVQTSVCVNTHAMRTQSRQSCTNPDCGGVLPHNPRFDVAPVFAGVDQSPPAYLDKVCRAENFDLAPDPKPTA